MNKAPGDNYHVSYLQILESGRCIKVSSILKLFYSRSDTSNYSLTDFIQSFSSNNSNLPECDFNLKLFLDEIADCDLPTFQSLAFIAGYSTHQYLK